MADSRYRVLAEYTHESRHKLSLGNLTLHQYFSTLLSIPSLTAIDATYKKSGIPSYVTEELPKPESSRNSLWPLNKKASLLLKPNPN